MITRRQTLKAMLLAPFVGLFKPKEKRKLEITAKVDEVITVPEGETWQINNIIIDELATGMDFTITLEGYRT